jgi:hypothetical protein
MMRRGGFAESSLLSPVLETTRKRVLQDHLRRALADDSRHCQQSRQHHHKSGVFASASSIAPTEYRAPSHAGTATSFRDLDVIKSENMKCDCRRGLRRQRRLAVQPLLLSACTNRREVTCCARRPSAEIRYRRFRKPWPNDLD